MKKCHMSKSDARLCSTTAMNDEQDTLGPVVGQSETTTVNGTTVSSESAASLSVINDSVSRDPHQDPELPAMSTLVTKDSDPMDINAPASATETTTNLDPIAHTDIDSHASVTMDIDTPTSATEPTTNLYPIAHTDINAPASVTKANPDSIEAANTNIDTPTSVARGSATEPTSKLDPIAHMDIDAPTSVTEPNLDPIEDANSNINTPASAARSSATESTSNQDPGEEAHTSSLTNVTVTVPAWLTVLNMDTYFQESSNMKAWQVLVQSLYKFEEVNTINRVCHCFCYKFSY